MQRGEYCGDGTYLGEGVYVLPVNIEGVGPQSLNISDNTISEFGDAGINVVGAATGNLISNHISSTIDHLFVGILVGSQVGPTESGFTITGNQISAPQGKGGAGIIVGYTTNSAVGLNLVNNFDIGIRLDFSSTTDMALNVLSNVTFGAELECDLNSSILASGMTGSTSSSPPAGVTGIEVEDTDCRPAGSGNSVSFDVVNGFCGGISDDGNSDTIDDNLFENIGPGGDFATSNSSCL